MHLAGGEDYVPVSGLFTFNDLSARGFCLNVSIVDDDLVEALEEFFVCASTDQLQAPDIQFIPSCASVNIADNNGIYEAYRVCPTNNNHNFLKTCSC